MADTSLPDLHKLLKVTLESEEIQGYFRQLCSGTGTDVAVLRRELLRDLPAIEIWQSAAPAQQAFAKLADELRALEDRLVQEKFPEYEQMRDDATSLGRLMDELQLKRTAATRKQEIEASAAALEHEMTQMRKLDPQEEQAPAKRSTTLKRWWSFRGKTASGDLHSKHAEKTRELDQALSSAKQTSGQVENRLSAARHDINRYLNRSDEHTALREKLSAAREALCTSLVEDGLLPLHLRPELATRLEAQSRDFHGMRLRIATAPGLAHLSDKQFDVATRSGRALTDLLESLRGGSIGLSGPRGAGKTTLLHTMAEPGRRFRQRRSVVSLVIPAPVEYDAKEFVLHLFQRMCSNVLDSASPTVTQDLAHTRKETSLFRYALIARTATALLILGSAGWLVSVLLRRPPNTANLALAPVLGALLPLAPVHFRRWVNRPVVRTAFLCTAFALTWWSTGSLSLPPSLSAQSWSWSTIFVATTAATVVMAFSHLRPGPMGSGVLLTAALIGTAALQMAAPHPGVLKTITILAAGTITWIYVHSAAPPRSHWSSSMRGVLLTGAVISMVCAVQRGQLPEGFAWLAWGSALAVLALAIEIRLVERHLQVTVLVLASVPLALGGIGTNWPIAITGLVLLFLGFTADLHERSSFAMPWPSGRFIALATSEVARSLTGQGRVLLPLAGTVLVTAAGISAEVGLFAVVSALVVLAASLVLGRTKEISAQEMPVTVSGRPDRESWADGLAAEAKRHDDEIRFQQTISATWQRALKLSGGSGFSVGLDTTSGGGTSRQTVAHTYPQIVDGFREFLTKVCTHGPVVIAIDEIDKLSPEAAGKFLNDIKAIFGVPGCYYLVSLSEDAMASFERRGMPIRDVFESSFDDVVHLDHLTFEESRTLLTARVAGLPLALLGICYVVSGGIPREVIRIARRVFSVVEQRSEQRINWIARFLTDIELTERTRGTEMSASGLDTETSSAVLKVVDICRRPFEPGAAGEPVRCPLQPADPLRRTSTALIAYNLLLSTMVDFLDAAGEEHIRTASEESGPRHFGRLAHARRLISVESSLAWAEIAAFRESWNLSAVEYPVLFTPSGGVEPATGSS